MFWGADHNPNQKPLPPNRWQTKIKLDISFSEKVILKPDLRNIIHPYSDFETVKSKVPNYTLTEVIAEKLRSLIQRNRPRDIYDISYLRKIVNEDSFQDIKKLLFQKAEYKNIEIKEVSDFVNNEKSNRNKRAWHSSLSDHLPEGALHDFDTNYYNVKQFVQQILNS